MLVLTVLGIILALILIISLCIYFNEHCYNKFSYYFFTKPTFFITSASVFLLFAGYEWYCSSLQAKETH